MRLARNTCAGGEPDCAIRAASSSESVAISSAPTRVSAMFRDKDTRSPFAARIAVASFAEAGQRLPSSSRLDLSSSVVAADGTFTSNASPPSCRTFRYCANSSRLFCTCAKACCWPRAARLAALASRCVWYCICEVIVMYAALSARARTSRKTIIAASAKNSAAAVPSTCS